jgi:perosamine synthetase
MIFQNMPDLSGNERKYVLDCIDTNWISSMGSYITRFEESFSALCGCRHGVACANGTAALHLAFAALGIGFGDEVIVPDFTLIADSNMVILAGAKPVFVDVDRETWCLDPEKIEAAITPRTKAILAVHMYGHPCDIDRLQAIADSHGLLLIEDAAQGHGTEYKGRQVGGFGRVGCFSFYASKTLTTGEGGMVVTNDEEIAQRLRLLRSHGFEGTGRQYVHRVLGFNYRLTNLQAAIGLAQTECIAEKVARKREIAKQYSGLLKGLPGLLLPTEKDWAKSTYWNYTVVIEDDFPASREEVGAAFDAAKVQTRMPFNALHRQPVYVEGRDPRFPATGGNFPVSEWLSDRALCLPSGVGLTAAEVETVAGVLRKFSA